MHKRISSLFFLWVATIEETQSVGSETGVITPRVVIRLSSDLTLSCIAAGMRQQV